MAEKWCGTCHRQYILPEGNKDPGYCSDRCFSAAHADGDGRSRLGWFCKVLVFAGLVTLAVFRVEAFSYLARNVPAASPYASWVLGWLGGEAHDRLVAQMLEGDQVLRSAAIDAFVSTGEPGDAHTRLAAKAEEIRKLELRLSKPELGQLLLALGHCKVVEMLDEVIAGMEDQEVQVSAIRALGMAQDAKGEAPLNEALNDVEWKLKNDPHRISACLWALAQLSDPGKNRLNRFFPYLTHESPVVRLAAVDAIATDGADYDDIKNKQATAPSNEQYNLKQAIQRLEKGVAAIQSAGPAEKDPAVRAAMASAVAKMTGETPEWGK